MVAVPVVALKSCHQVAVTNAAKIYLLSGARNA
jgi:hypothetical protein